LRENARNLKTSQLWMREVETPEEEALRRMAAIETYFFKLNRGECVPAWFANEPISIYADKLSPPPPVKEVEIDLDTLEPIEEVPVWENEAGVWTAGFVRSVWVDFTIEQKLVHYCVNRTAATGSAGHADPQPF